MATVYKLRPVKLVGRKIRQLRKDRNLTQTELSARIGASGFLPMPCDTDEILREVHRITGGQVRSSQAALVVPPVAFDDEPTGEGMRLP